MSKESRFGGGTERVKIDRMMPMQEALEEVERQLTLRAFDQHKTTTKVAQALGISPPSASRKLRKWVFVRE